MKKSLVLGLMAAFFLSAGPANGQGLAVGAKVGGSFATVGGSGIPDGDAVDNVTGLTIGGIAKFGLAPMFAIQPEVLFSQKGYGASLGELGTAELSLSYVDIPVLARISPPVPGGVSPYLIVGPTASFRAGCSVTASLGGDTETVDCDDASAGGSVAQIKNTSFSLTAGGGLGFGLPMGEAVLDVRYDLGLNTIHDPPADEEAMDIKNRAFAVTLGVTLGL